MKRLIQPHSIRRNEMTCLPKPTGETVPCWFTDSNYVRRSNFFIFEALLDVPPQSESFSLSNADPEAQTCLLQEEDRKVLGLERYRDKKKKRDPHRNLLRIYASEVRGIALIPTLNSIWRWSASLIYAICDLIGCGHTLPSSVRAQFLRTSTLYILIHGHRPSNRQYLSNFRI